MFPTEKELLVARFLAALALLLMLATAGGVTTDGKLSPFSNFLYPGAWTARRHSTYEVSSVEENQKEKAKRGEER